MASNDRHTRRWVSEQLHDLLGYSNDAVTDMLIGSAKKASSIPALIQELKAFDIPDGDKLLRFADKLYSKVPRAVSKSQVVQKKRRAKETASLQSRFQHDDFTTIDSDDDDWAAMQASVQRAKDKKAAKKKRKEDKKAEKRRKKEEKQARKRKRRERASLDNRDEEEDVDFFEGGISDEDAEEQHARKRAKVESKLSAQEQKELARLTDLRERDELDARLRAKEAEDNMRARTVEEVEAKESMEERRAVLESSSYKQEEMMSALRRRAREKYTQKREGQVREILRREIDEERFLFEDQPVTKDEQAALARKEEVLKLADENIQMRSNDDTGYRVPAGLADGKVRLDEDERQKVLNARYEDTEEYVTDQKKWEEVKIGKAYKKNQEWDQGEYDLVHEDQLEFIKLEIAAGLEPEREVEDEEEETLADKRSREMMTLAEVRQSLPIFKYRDGLLEAVSQYQSLVVVAETGSGKTTQIPQYLWEAGFANDGRMIGVTQPRRVAAMSVAKRVADETGTRLGQEVGYCIRFEDQTSERTVIKYMTDGMLLREFLNDPELSRYSAIMVDEAHERTLHTDILFGLVKDIARTRTDLKLIVSSATLDAEKFSDFFDDAPLFEIPGRRYPVEIYHTKAPESDYLDAAIVSVLQIHLTQELPGDVLVFLNGQEEIETAKEILAQRIKTLGSKVHELLILPIYANLPSSEQAKIFEPAPPNARKVVLATNIAETSLTIDGVVYVIDPGFCKQKSYNPRTGMEALIIVPVSKASAKQRCGRAGRVSAGKCFRLYTKYAYDNEMDPNTVPEIQRTNLCNVVLMLKSLGINDLLHFDFLDPPPAETMIRALEHLYALSALNDHGELTRLGRRMAEFPMDPQLAKCLVEAEKFGCVEEVLTICAMLSANAAIFYRPRDKKVAADTQHKNFWKPWGDHFTLLNVYKLWEETQFNKDWCFENFVQHRSMQRARDVRDQLENLCERVEVDIQSNNDNVAIRKAICSGYFYHTARLNRDGSYKTWKHNQQVQIHPSSCLAQETPKWVCYFELVLTSKEYLRNVIEIEPKWLCEVAPHFYKAKDVAEQDAKMKKVKIRKAKAPDVIPPNSMIGM